MSEPPNSSPTASVSGLIVPGFGDGENTPAGKPKACHYFKTTPGILKIVSVVLGLISLALITYGYIMAELFSVTEKSCDFGKNKTTCRNAYRYEICKKMNSRLPESRVDDEALNCPSKWFVTPPLCLFGLIWLTTLVFLILLSSMDLSKYRRFLRTDFVGHTIAGIMTVFSASIVLCFVMQVKSDDMCDKEHLRVEFIEAWRNDNPRHLGIPLPRRRPNFTAILVRVLPKCQEIENKTYLHGHFLVGGLLGFLTGIIYGIIGTLVILNGTPSDFGEDEEMGEPTQKVNLPKESRPYEKDGDTPRQSLDVDSEGPGPVQEEES